MSFQKNSSPLFVESDEFSGGQTTGSEESLFFVYAAQVLEVLSSETYSLSATKLSGVSFRKHRIR